ANAGPAVARTAREVRERAARVAAELLECATEDVRVEESRVFVAGMPDRAVSLGRLAHAAIKSKALKALGEPGLGACTYFHPETVTLAFGAQGAVVEVGVESGRPLSAWASVRSRCRADGWLPRSRPLPRVVSFPREPAARRHPRHPAG